jgi:hypothetical protein
MSNFTDFKDQSWINKSNEILRRRGYQCEDCDVPATCVHICYYQKGRKIWEYQDDAYKCYCQYHFEIRRDTESDLKKILVAFSTDELDRLHLIMKNLSNMPLGKRATIMEQLYADAKNKHSPYNAFMEDEESEE